ncbi:hypothetical protein NQ176_g7724 [Zarea fungicola]|uniref:Uncharacterized protein n=1 Tax=Zarea fungicola TaxID=93591 RepID=A0ACC1MXP7_9HYPO|nr:hypothetical protein NQ176_g7724 [Lecanicillium fungicola]
MADAELQRLFSAGKAIEPDVATELQSMMRLHDLSAEDLFYKWESYCIKMDLDAGDALTLTNVRNLKQNIQDALEKSAAASSHSGVGGASSAVKVKTERKLALGTPRAGGGGAARNGGGGTPASGTKLNRTGAAPGSAGGSALRRRMDAAKITSSPAGGMSDQLTELNGAPFVSSFSDRQNPGEVVEILNSQLASAETPLAPYPEPRIKLTAASDLKKMTYKPLAMKLSEASEILDDRIDDLATIPGHCRDCRRWPHRLRFYRG